MKVTLIGWTNFSMPDRFADTEFDDRMYQEWRVMDDDRHADILAEAAGRLCYDSFNLPNPDTATNQGYLANILRAEHLSVLEHATATFLVEGVSRSLLMEFRTHRHLSFSARSTRYMDESESGYVVPPALRSHLTDVIAPVADKDFTLQFVLDTLWDHAQDVYTDVFNLLVHNGSTRKEAREAAREFLSGATETEFVVTGNHHAWRDVLKKRLAPGAAAEIRELSAEILRQLKDLAPNTYQDFEDVK